MKYVDFYIVPFETFKQCTQFCNALVIKAYTAQNSCTIYTEDRLAAEILDNHLWHAQNTPFIPHHLRDDNPSIIEVLHTAANHKSPIWINVRAANETIDVRSWERCLQIVPNNNTQLEAARTQYRTYQKQGIPVNTHKIG
jgi:DNA polymerase IIIc chi subunit